MQTTLFLSWDDKMKWVAWSPVYYLIDFLNDKLKVILIHRKESTSQVMVMAKLVDSGSP